MKKEKLFLFLSLGLVIFLQSHYITGLYYDHDIPFYAEKTLLLFSEGGLESFFYRVIPPGINFIFSFAFLVFGKSFISIQLFSLIFNLVSIILLYFLSRKILSHASRFYYILPLFFSLFAASQAIHGHTCNLENFLVTFEIAAVLFLGLGEKNGKNYFYAASGFLLGLAFLVKQSAFATLVSALVFIMFARILKKEGWVLFWKRVVLFIAMFLIPLFLAYLYFSLRGYGSSYLNSLFHHALKYSQDTKFSRYAEMAFTLNYLWQKLRVEIIFLGIPALTAIFYSGLKYKNRQRLLIVLWFIGPALIISLFGFHYRHHFLEVMPAFAALALIGLSDIWEGIERICKKRIMVIKLLRIFGICLVAVPFIYGIAPLVRADKVFDYFFITRRYANATVAQKAKYAEKLSLFSLNRIGDTLENYESVRRFLTAQYIKDNTGERDRIYVWDDIDSLAVYFWSERRKVEDTPTSKFILLPERLRDNPFFIEVDLDYKVKQKQLIWYLSAARPVYIVVIKSTLYIPGSLYTSSELLSLEREAFDGFFDLLSEKYILEKTIMDCLIYKLKQGKN